MLIARFVARAPRRAFGLAVVVCTLIAIATLVPLGVLGALQPGALMFVPVLLLAAMLFAGRYPGERLIRRLARARPRRSAARVLKPKRPAVALLRGGRLIAVALAGRAPPAFAAG